MGHTVRFDVTLIPFALRCHLRMTKGWHRKCGAQQNEGPTMLTFILGLSLGACIGAAALGICSSSYEHQADE